MSLIDSIENLTTKKTKQPALIHLRDIPVVFLSYDEPNADENFRHLKKFHPKEEMVLRVHGVKGFDAAHKACAKLANSDRFFTVDADCVVDAAIWKRSLEITSDISRATFSWSSRNIVNGLVYGNGGIKLWYSDYVKNMRSHEAANKSDNKNNIDFCWDFDNYKQMNNTYGVVMNNATPYQAFRAGFREGIKMGLDQGHKVDPDEFKFKMYPGNYARWLVWMTVGRDVENGAWAIYGARLAAWKLYIEEFDHTLVADYDWFKEFWDETYGITTVQGQYLEDKSHALLIELRDKLRLPLVELDDTQSEWFKHVNVSPAKGMGWSAILNHSALPLFGFGQK